MEEKKLLSVSRIYDRYVSPHGTVNFATWKAAEEYIFNRNKKNDPEKKFLSWLNEKYEEGQSYWSADGENTSWWEKNKESILASAGAMFGKKEPEAPADKKPDDPKKILGFNPVGFWIGTGLIAGTLIYVGIQIFKPKKVKK